MHSVSDSLLSKRVILHGFLVVQQHLTGQSWRWDKHKKSDWILLTFSKTFLSVSQKGSQFDQKKSSYPSMKQSYAAK